MPGSRPHRRQQVHAKMHGASACENTAVDRRMVLRQHLEDEIPLTQLAHRPLQHGPLNHGWPRPVDAHSFPIDELLRQAGVPLFDLNDGTLSSGEMATARITSALRRLGQARWSTTTCTYYSAGSVHTVHRRSRSIRYQSTQERLTAREAVGRA